MKKVIVGKRKSSILSIGVIGFHQTTSSLFSCDDLVKEVKKIEYESIDSDKYLEPSKSKYHK